MSRLSVPSFVTFALDEYMLRCFSLRGQCILLFLSGQLNLECGRGNVSQRRMAA